MKKPRLFDYIVFIIFIFLIIASFLFLKTESGYVTVSANGIEYRYSLDRDGIYQVQGELGETVFEIKDGKIRFLDSPCPNKTCIALGFQDTVACLPNKVIATIYSRDEEDVDAIAR